MIEAGHRIVDVVEQAMCEIVSAAHRVEGSYVRLPILFPSGSDVVIRVSGGPDRFFVTDFGLGYSEAELMGASSIYLRQAKQVSKNSGVEFDQNAFFSLEVPRDRLPGAIVTVANCCSEAVSLTAFKSAERAVNVGSELLVHKLTEAFGARYVHRQSKLLGASHHEWQFAALVDVEGKRNVFEFSTKHPNSIATVSMKMDDLARVSGSPGRFVMVHSKAELGTYLGVLAHSANVIQDDYPIEKIKTLALAA